MRYAPLPMTLRQLQYAGAVAEELSFRRAAERCHVSQPSLSAQIAELESTLGVQLFERDRRGVRPTPAGREVLDRARALLLGAEDLVATCQRHSDPLAGTLRLGVIPTVGPYLLPDLDPALRTAFPALDLQWTEDKTANLVEQVRSGELDGALLALDVELGGLEEIEIGEDPFVLAAPLTHPLAEKQTPVGMEVLADQRVLLLDDGHCFRDHALDLCATAGASEHGFRATSLSTLVQMAAGGDALTLLPRMAVEVENRRARLAVRPFRKPAPTRRIGFAWRRGFPGADAFRRLAATAKKAFARAARAR